ncbi:hypothetical protein NLJ89_g4137 [Agrocybe chaxingu]|uniref:C2H2-type domain-containing protein n=1 Tax=Agrocybe chaxingu TaxID=84603 RepID=A0A9W8MW82_9AGAR|nr:hypothetical protein NLJ89_g4137 [Agrocybe chaxingu]
MNAFAPLDPNRVDIFWDIATGVLHGYHWEQLDQHQVLTAGQINAILSENYPNTVFMSEMVPTPQGYRMVPIPDAVPSYLNLRTWLDATLQARAMLMPESVPLSSGPSQDGPLASSSRANVVAPSSSKALKKKTSRRAGGKAAIVGAPTTQRPRRGQRTALEDKDPLEWPYVCDVCQQRTRTQHDMDRHLKKTDHSEKSFPCSAYGCTCGKVFTREDGVKRHAKDRGLIT